MTGIRAVGTFRLADVFGKTFAIYRRRFVPFFVLTIIASIPGYLAIFAAEFAIGALAKGAVPFYASWLVAQVGQFGLVVVPFVYITGLVLTFAVTQTLAGAAVMHGVVQELRGQRFSIAGSLRIFLLRFLPMTGVVVVTTLVISFGVAVLVVPGFILACMYFVSMPVCAAELAGISASVSRSIFLTEGHRWQIFGTMVLLAVAGVILSVVVGVIFAPAGVGEFLLAYVVLRLIINSFNGVLVSVFYYELRAAKEGVDIDKIAGVFD
jgi:hypothetical protein